LAETNSEAFVATNSVGKDPLYPGMMSAAHQYEILWGLLIGCGDDGAATPDGGWQTNDGGMDEDAAIDAAVLDDCPNRMAPTGEHPGPLVAEEIHAGDVTIQSALDIQTLAGKRAITGSLTIASTTLTTVVLPDLESIGIQLESTTGSTVSTLELPKLETVGGYVRLRATATSILLPSLESVGQNVEVTGASIDAHCLRRADGTQSTATVLFTGMTTTTFELPKYERGPLGIFSATITSLDLPRFTAGSLILQGAALTTLRMPVATMLTELSLRDTPVSSITIPATATYDVVGLHNVSQLTSLAWLSGVAIKSFVLQRAAKITNLTGVVGAGLRHVSLYENPVLADVTALAPVTVLDGFEVVDNDMLTTIDLPNLTNAGQLFIVNEQAKLTALRAPALVTITGGTSTPSQIRNNPMLPNCQATVIRDRAPSRDGWQVSGNQLDTCL
jgi:hypothetical protein